MLHRACHKHGHDRIVVRVPWEAEIPAEVNVADRKSLDLARASRTAAEGCRRGDSPGVHVMNSRRSEDHRPERMLHSCNAGSPVQDRAPASVRACARRRAYEGTEHDDHAPVEDRSNAGFDAARRAHIRTHNTTASAASPGHPAGHTATHGRIVATVAGSTHVLLGPGTFGVTVQQDPLAYEAVLFADGTVRGHWRYDYYESGVHLVFSGPVNCMAVQGNRAWIGGPIAKTTDPASVGLGAWWQVADLGSVVTRSSRTVRPSLGLAHSMPPRRTATAGPTPTSSLTSSPAE